MLVGCRSVIVSLTVVVGAGIEQTETVTKLRLGGDNSDECRQRKLHVLVEAGETHPDEAEAARPVVQRTVEQRAGELADPGGVVGPDRQ